jgi:hypothetical protein
MPDVLRVKLLEFCEPGELVRVGDRWAIVGRHAKGKCLVYISGENAPYREDITDEVRRCLSYGMEFDLVPDYASTCDMDTPFVHGALYFSSRDGRDDVTRHLAIVVADNETRCLNLENFQYGEKPKDQFVSFLHWGVWIRLPPHRNPILLCPHGQ